MIIEKMYSNYILHSVLLTFYLDNTSKKSQYKIQKSICLK